MYLVPVSSEPSRKEGRRPSSAAFRLGCKSATSVALLVILAGCGSVQVDTSVSPDARFDRRRTFQIMSVPERRQGRSTSVLEPMIESSGANRALREEIGKDLATKGFVATTDRADFAVAYYATAREKLDVTRWDYGYAWRPFWWRGWRRGPAATVTEYNQGTVIVDVIDPATKQLLWRGRGVSPVSDNAEKYQEGVRKAIDAILAKFPQ